MSLVCGGLKNQNRPKILLRYYVILPLFFLFGNLLYSSSHVHTLLRHCFVFSSGSFFDLFFSCLITKNWMSKSGQKLLSLSGNSRCCWFVSYQPLAHMVGRDQVRYSVNSQTQRIEMLLFQISKEKNTLMEMPSYETLL